MMNNEKIKLLLPSGSYFIHKNEKKNLTALIIHKNLNTNLIDVYLLNKKDIQYQKSFEEMSIKIYENANAVEFEIMENKKIIAKIKSEILKIEIDVKKYIESISI